MITNECETDCIANALREIYRDRAWQGEGERHRCRWFQQNGLRISLEKDVHGHISTCYLRVAVNPRKLIDPNSSYLGTAG